MTTYSYSANQGNVLRKQKHDAGKIGRETNDVEGCEHINIALEPIDETLLI